MEKSKLKNGYVILSNAKNKKFKVATVGSNNEKVNGSETLETLKNAQKNIAANLKANHGEFVIIKDMTKKVEQWYRLNSDGTTQEA